MRRVSPEINDLARRLLAQEAAGRCSPPALAEATERACQKLRQRIALLLGQAGFHALLTRALQLAAAEAPFLQGVRVDGEAAGPLPGLRESVAGRDRGEAAAGLAAVLASFIGLLTTFIGRNLGLRLVYEVWPELAPAPPGTGKEEAKE
mgnify:CR=1 FL=1